MKPRKPLVLSPTEQLRRETHGRSLYLSRLLKAGQLDKARAYATANSLTIPSLPQGDSPATGGGGLGNPGAGSGNESTPYRQIETPINTQIESKIEIVDEVSGSSFLASPEVAMSDRQPDHPENQKRVIEVPRGSAEGEEVTEREPVAEVKLGLGRLIADVSNPLAGPDVRVGTEGSGPPPIEPFKPVREAVPEGVRWARVVREAPNPLLKGIRFEDEGLNSEVKALWVSWIQGKNGGRGLLSRVVPVWENEDREQGGWTIWRKGLVRKPVLTATD